MTPYAAMRAGYIHVPVNYALTGGELEYLLTDSGASLVLVDPAQAPTLDAVLDSLPALTPLALQPAAGEAPDGTVLGTALETGDVTPVDSLASGDDLAQLLYTSGTTSRPKGAMMTHSALVHEYLSCILSLDLTADDEPLVTMPLYHSAAMHVFAMPYLSLGREGDPDGGCEEQGADPVLFDAAQDLGDVRGGHQVHGRAQ